MALSELVGILPTPGKWLMPTMMVSMLTQKMSYESVKKPTPATRQARTWYHPKGAASISARARRRRSLTSVTWTKSLWKLWKALLPVDQRCQYKLWMSSKAKQYCQEKN